MKQYDQDMLDNNNYHKLDRAIAKFQELLTEKDLLIKSQEQQNHRLSSEIENIRETISNQEQIIDNISEQLKRKEHNLMDRQKSIRALIVFRNSSILYWLWLILTPGKKIIKKWIQNSSFLNLDNLNSIWHKLLITPQYSPREIDIPKSYYQKNQLETANLAKISLVTPSYNHAHFIEATVDSILKQEYPNLEYIIQDGKSQDNTNEVLSKYGDRIKFRSEKDKGQANAINKGFSATSGDIMAWLNSDDLLLPGTLFYVAEYFAEHPEVDVIYGHRIIINEDNQETGRWVLPPHDDNMLQWADYVPQETMFWRRELWDKVGGYVDESFQFAMDWELILRFRQSGAVFKRVPRFLGAFRVHQAQKTQDWNAIGEAEMNILRHQCHDYIPSSSDVGRNIKGYIIRSLLHYQLYSFKKLCGKVLP